MWATVARRSQPQETALGDWPLHNSQTYRQTHPDPSTEMLYCFNELLIDFYCNSKTVISNQLTTIEITTQKQFQYHSNVWGQ